MKNTILLMLIFHLGSTGIYSQIPNDTKDSQSYYDNISESISEMGTPAEIIVGNPLLFRENLAPEDYFITTWKTDNIYVLSSNATSITIPTTGGGYNYDVSWKNDGIWENGFTGNASHDYGTLGIYTVAIRGIFPRIDFNSSWDNEKILSIEQWGSNVWSSMSRAFVGCSNLVGNASDTPDLSMVTDMSEMFSYADAFNGDTNFGNWDVSRVNTMEGMFERATAFNQDIGNWDVGNVIYMSYMFYDATAFNQDIGNWDVSNVEEMWWMFDHATAFDQNLGAWNVSNVADMDRMFWGVTLSPLNYDALLIGWNSRPLQDNVYFNGGYSTYCDGELARQNMISQFNWHITDGGLNCDSPGSFITTWKTTTPNESITVPTFLEVTYNYTVDWGDGNIETGFTGNATHIYGAAGTHTVKINGEFPHIYFNNTGDPEKILSIEQWGSNVWSSMKSAFAGCSSLVGNAIDTPDLSNVTDMSYMFFASSSFNQNIGNWDVSNVNTMESMFSGATAFNQNIGNWDVNSVSDMNGMFYNATAFDQNLGAWNVSNVLNMEDMFNRVTLSTANYDALLNGWNNLPLKNNVAFHGGNSTYCDGELARQNMISQYNWNITDGGLNCPFDPSNYFITIWKTDNISWKSSNASSIMIPTYGEGYNYDVSWKNDGVWENGFTGNATHDYGLPGTYTVAIRGVFPQIYFNFYQYPISDASKIISIEQWGSNVWRSMAWAFSYCTNLVGNSQDTPNLSMVTDMTGMFNQAMAFNGDSNFGNWDVSNVTSMAAMFHYASSFNHDIGNWDVSNVTSMQEMFSQATAFNQNIGNWDVSSVNGMVEMLFKARAFDQNIGNWNVSNVTRMNYMLNFVTLSTANYDALLNGWNSRPLQDNIYFHGGYSTYCDGETARQNIISQSHWNITDGGKDLNCISNEYFTTTWKTTTPNESINIPTFSEETYNYTVDWGDSIIETDFTENASHIYGAAGTYTVKIYGEFPRIYFNNSGDREKIKTIENWGNNVWSSMNAAFAGCSNLVGNAIDTPDLSNVTDISYMFSESSSFNQNIGNWDVSNVTNMRYLFYEATAFNQDIGNWEVSSVNTMESMFSSATAFNQNIGNWDVSNVNTMESMFSGATAFNQNIGNWNVSNVNTMESMFSGATAFDQNLGAWNVSNVLDMEDMFSGITLSTINYDALLLGWNNLPLKNNVAFHGGNSTYCNGEIARQNIISQFNWTITDGGLDCSFVPSDYFITTWRTTSTNETLTIPTTGSGYNYIVNWGDGATDAGLTGNAPHIYVLPGTYEVKISGDFPRIYFNNSGDAMKIRSVEQWGTIVWRSMNAAFAGAGNLVSNAMDIPNLSMVTDMYGMFAYARKFRGDANFGSWDVSNVNNMYGMFAGASVFNQNINGWNVGNVTNMENMFNGATLFNKPLGDWNVSSVLNTKNMFRTALHFNQNIGGWNIENVLNMEYMFAFAIRFDQDLGNWNVGNVTKAHNMFKGVKLSTVNYDGLLNGWSTLPLKNNVKFSGGNSNYCSGELARQNMISQFNWSITDGGKNCGDPMRGDTLDVNSDSPLSGVVLYPNPMQDELILGNPQNLNLESACLYDLTGRLILTLDLRSMTSGITLDVSKLSSATYIVIIKGKDGQESKLMLKE